MRLVKSLFWAMALSLCAAPAFAAKVTLAWDPNIETDLAGYKLYYGEKLGEYTGNYGDYGPSPVDIPLTSLGNAQVPEFSLTGLPSCIHLYFVLTAYNTAGQESAFSNSVDTTVVTKPSLVEFKVEEDGQKITLKWSSPVEQDKNDTGQITGYRVQYGSTPGEPYIGDFAVQGKSPLSINSDQTSFSLTGLPPGSSVYVRVEAVCEDGSAGRSDEKSNSTLNVDPNNIDPNNTDPNNAHARGLAGGCTLSPTTDQTGCGWGGALLVSLLLGVLRFRRRD